jgi:hypothetical protein
LTTNLRIGDPLVNVGAVVEKQSTNTALIFGMALLFKTAILLENTPTEVITGAGPLQDQTVDEVIVFTPKKLLGTPVISRTCVIGTAVAWL